MINTLVAFVTDIGFLAPSLVAARQLVAQKVHTIADITIYTVDINSEIVSELSSYYADKHITFASLDASLFTPPANVIFHKNHVPVTALARLSLHEVLPGQYENIVYLDGDVQIVGDVSKLVLYSVPMGKILAGRGSAWLDSPDDRVTFTPDNYLENLGGISPEEYFNSGVLAFKRKTWDTAAPRALNFFYENSQICIRHDQSALNAIFKDNVVCLPPKYNFHSIYAGLYVQKTYKPAIIHFTGPRKPWNYVGTPWNYSGTPWGGKFHQNYVDILREHPKLKEDFKVTSRPFRNATGDLIDAVYSWLRTGKHLIQISKETKARRQKFFDYVRTGEFPI